MGSKQANVNPLYTDTLYYPIMLLYYCNLL